ncbi:MAG: methyltransferase domain-containing protein [Acetatifactor muris]|nr:methyltransferase domain-containing protein [Acetatifactor muris]MCM1525827.1 methyltransferase domain-containing protein [Bacteroides sp.]
MLKNTGERLILDQSWNLMTTLEHVHRYNAASRLVADKVVLDAACGTGYGSYYLSRTAKEVYGIDISEDAILYAKEHYESPNLHYVKMSVDRLEFEDDFFDVITSFETIEHITQDQQEAFLRNIKDKLKKEGMLIISTPNDQLLRDLSYGSYKNEFHLCEFNEQEYIDFLKKYFKHVRVFYQTVTEASGIVDKNNANAGCSYPVFSLVPENVMGRYYVAICSDAALDDEATMSSVLLPNPMDYFDEHYYKKQALLFIDSGNGFSDEQKIIGNYICRDGHTFCCKFDLYDCAPIKSIRFDPCEHGGNIVIHRSILNDQEVSFTPINSSGKTGIYDKFETLDPQYICLPDIGAADRYSLEISGEIFVSPDYIILAKQLETLEILKAQLAHKNQKIEQQESKIQSYQAQLDNLKKEIGEHTEYGQTLQKTVVEMNAAKIQLEEKINELNIKLEALNQKYIQKEVSLSSAMDVIANQKIELGNYKDYTLTLEKSLQEVNKEKR